MFIENAEWVSIFPERKFILFLELLDFRSQLAMGLEISGQ